VKILREPMQLLGLIRAALVLFSATVLPLTDAQQGTVMAALAALFGVIGAFSVAAEKAAPLVAGLVEAILALAVAFGAHLSADLQGAVMAFAAAAIGFYLRTQVVAPQPAPRGLTGVAS
jgi:nicotinamide riboside transporter PnuC